VSDDRTFDPTDARREEFRKQGRFARARDAGGVVATIAVLAVLAGTRDQIAGAAHVLCRTTLGDLGGLERRGVLPVLHGALESLVLLSGTAVAAAVGASVAIGAVQARFRTYGELLSPDLERLNPVSAFGKLFSPKRAGTETAVAVLRLAVVGGVAFHALSTELPTLTALSRVPLTAAVATMLASLGRIAGTATASLFLVAAVDYAQSFWTIANEMKMTRKEREDETRQSEGDPKAKARMKARARAIAKKRATTAVKNADVVVTNPTHVAVALRYSATDPAPVVLAKGHDEVALRIRAEARKHGIPILENRRLARALDAEVQVGRPVPAAHFAAVAKVLAFVFRLRGRGPKAVQGTKGASRSRR